MIFTVVIPARYASQRLPGKPLREISGKAMILHVVDRARESGAEQVIVATDDDRIADVCRAYSADVALTRGDHVSGTDRICEVAVSRGLSDERIVVNVQGDEPLMPGALIRQVAELLHDHADAPMATLAEPINDLETFLDPNIVKVVCSEHGNALYFSRAPIPWDRDHQSDNLPAGYENSLRHLGIYGYRTAALKLLSATPVSPLEQTEHLEQLRALWAGIEIQVGIAREHAGPGVDTEDDLAAAEKLLGG